MLPLGVRQFNGFGGCAFRPRVRTRQRGFTLAAESRQSRRLLRRLCPARPGVYGMIDAGGRLIYVGKAKSLRNRLNSYLQTEPADPKAGRIIEHTERVVWETAPHELAALVRELELIRRWRPEFNVRGQPGHFRAQYICIGRARRPTRMSPPVPRTERCTCSGPRRRGGRLMKRSVG